MDNTPANTGWLWIKDGFALFRRRPAQLISLFLTYFFLMLALSAVPLLGGIVSMMLVPVFSIAFLEACIQVEQDRRVGPGLLLAGFRSATFSSLMKLGVLYFLAAVLAIAASSLVDGGTLFDVMSGKVELNEKLVTESNMLSAILFSIVIYFPMAMALWFAAPLVAYQKMPVFKALFFSFFAVFRSTKVFLVYGICWLCVQFLGAMIAGSMVIPLAGLVGKDNASTMVLFPFVALFASMMNCSFYRSYTHFFGVPASLLEPT